MTNRQILEKAIKKAIKGGWQDLRWQKVLRDNNFIDVPVNEIIFNHDFAKALWNKPIAHSIEINRLSKPVYMDDWQYHLQQMVIDPDPIQYLGANI